MDRDDIHIKEQWSYVLVDNEYHIS
jgi:hypothetical protein